MNDSTLKFSQRYNYSSLPSQLKKEEISDSLRRQINYQLKAFFNSFFKSNYTAYYVTNDGKKLINDLMVYEFDRDPLENMTVATAKAFVDVISTLEFPSYLDVIEYIISHDCASLSVVQGLTKSFETCRSYYRVRNKKIIAIGDESTGQSFTSAIAKSKSRDFTSVEEHLVSAAELLKNGDWSGSVRESIHAVESVSSLICGKKTTLSAALIELKKNGNGLHPALSKALSQLYGWTNDTEGVRHSLVFKDKSNVEEIDAIFMLGICSNFVSYLIAHKETSESSEKLPTQ